jgi:SPP1 gp7 family putative phage head morphogenesis protein
MYADRTTGHISALRDGVVDGVRDQVVREVVLGEGNPEELTRNLLRQWEREGVPSIIETARGYRARVESHAALVARDQIGTLQMELTRERQLAAGITHFKWVTRGDSRVRPSHQDRAGKEYSWAEGANGQYPGGPINCRCHAQAVVKPPAIREASEFVPLMTEGPVTPEPSPEFRARRPT